MGGGFPSAGNRCFFLTFNEVGRTYQIQKKAGIHDSHLNEST